jgi:hypothetical protein
MDQSGRLFLALLDRPLAEYCNPRLTSKDNPDRLVGRLTDSHRKGLPT